MDVIVQSQQGPIGWICPKCGAVYAPFVVQCFTCGSAKAAKAEEKKAPEAPQKPQLNEER